MTSRERLLAVLRGQQPDRVPISTYELVGWETTDWYAQQPSYRELLRVIREETDCLYMTGPNAHSGIWNFLTEADPDCCQTRTWREGERVFTEVTVHTPKGPLRNIVRVDDGIYTTWCLEHWLKGEEDVDRLLSIPYAPMTADISHLGPLKQRLGDNGIPLINIADPLCVVSELFEFSTFLTLVYEARERIDELMEVMSHRLYSFLEPVIDAGSGSCFRICGPEYATPPYLPPRIFKELVVDYDQRLIHLIQNAGGFARIHCHGRIGQVLDYIASMEPDGLDPLEAPPDGDITLDEVKRRVGDRVCLFGNIQLKDLEYRTENEVEELVRKAIEQAAKGGGFVLLPTAAPINSPLSQQTERNYYRLIEAGRKYGRY